MINVGRNYWAFDTQVGLTWFHKATGTEISVLPGLMINTMNPATNYRSGTEFHLDFMVNQFVAKDIAIGIQGSWYKQIDGDSGPARRSARSWASRSAWAPPCCGRPSSSAAAMPSSLKWQHDISNTNRLNGDWGSVTMSWRF